MEKKKWSNLASKLLITTMLSALILPQASAYADASSSAASAATVSSSVYEGTYTNVALGKPYTITQAFRDEELMDYETRTDGDNGSPKGGELTDGKIATSKLHDVYCNCDMFFLDKNWVGYTRMVSRSVEIDLQSPKFIQHITGGFLQERFAGVELPRYVSFFVSDDKLTWRQAGVQRPVISTSQEASRKEIQQDGINVTARYVKVEFEVGMFSFLDEITINGRDAVPSDPGIGTLPLEALPVDVAPPTLEERGGVNHMYLATYYPPETVNGPLGVWKQDDFKSFIAHTDTSGNRTSWMFDTIIFANGGDVYNDYGTKDKWQQYMDQLFTADRHLDALNKATIEAGTALGDTGHKTKVVISIPYSPPESKNAWGELNGEMIHFGRVNGDDASFDSRKKAVDWFITQVVQKFQQSSYSNLELAGFYWTHEEVGFGSTHEEDLIKYVSTSIHAKNKKLYWIPFFQANGSTIWKELGFDAIMLQPNYYFKSYYGPNEASGQVDLSRLRNTIGTAKRFGMGVEVEADYQMAWTGWATDYDGQLYNSDYAMRKYYAYLNEYKKAGLDQGVVGYYWGARTVMEEVVASNRPKLRETYEEAAKFVNGAYQVRTLDTTTIPLPAGDVWDNPILLEATDGYAYTHYVNITASKWLKFPMKAKEDWIVTLTPLNGASMDMEARLWAPSQTPHSGFSYNKGTQEQSLIVSNPGTADSAGMLRVFPSSDSGTGKFRITLRKPLEDGTSMMNAKRLPNMAKLDDTALASGQEIWYKINGNKAYSLSLVPQNNADLDLELYWDANSGQAQATSSRGAGITEVINYNNQFSDSFIYYVKVKAKTAGSYTLYNGIQPPGGNPQLPGITWDSALQLEAKEGELFTSTVTGAGDGDWYKIPLNAGEDWIVQVNAIDGAKVGVETRYFTTDAFHPHGGFSYSNEWTTIPEHNLLVSNRGTTDTWAMIRVTGFGSGGAYKLSLKKPQENGSSKMNALPLFNDYAVKGSAQAGEVTWYKIAGKANYNVELMPFDSSDYDMELFWGSNYDNVLASSSQPAQQTKLMSYANPYDAKFIYYVKVTAKTAGSYKIGTAPGLTLKDKTPPTAGPVTINNGAAYTNNTAVTVALSASDEGSGVYQMQLSDDGQTYSDWETYTTIRSIQLPSSDGAKTIFVRYKDFAGNISGTAQARIVLDQTAPIVQFTGNAGTYTVDQTISITCSASDALSGIASSTCKNIASPAYTFGIGTHTFKVTAVDGAGNIGESSVTFKVTITFDSLYKLIKQFFAKKGIPASLITKLVSAQEAANKGNHSARDSKFQAFLYEVDAQKGKSLSEQQADVLISLARAMLQ